MRTVFAYSSVAIPTGLTSFLNSVENEGSLTKQYEIVYSSSGVPSVNTISLSEKFLTFSGTVAVFNLYYTSDTTASTNEAFINSFMNDNFTGRNTVTIVNRINTSGMDLKFDDVKLIARNDSIAKESIIKVRDPDPVQLITGIGATGDTMFLPVVSEKTKGELTRL